MVFFEILEKERQKNVNGLLQVPIDNIIRNMLRSCFDADDAGGLHVCRLHFHGAPRSRRGSF